MFSKRPVLKLKRMIGSHRKRAEFTGDTAGDVGEYKNRNTSVLSLYLDPAPSEHPSVSKYNIRIDNFTQ